MPVIQLIKFPTNVEYLVVILDSEGKTNNQTQLPQDAIFNVVKVDVANIASSLS